MRTDPVGDRMKDAEKRYRDVVDPQQYTIVRLDGKAFHSFTRAYEKPFDNRILHAMGDTARDLMFEVPEIKFAYTQSDEISLLFTDFATPTTQQWYGGQVQKMTTVLASMASVFFNRALDQSKEEVGEPKVNDDLAFFDARVLTLTTRRDTSDYFLWRNRDAQRNSVSAAAQSMFSHRQLQGVGTIDMIEMMAEKGVDFHKDFSVAARNGWVHYKDLREEDITYTRKDTGETLSETVMRHWVTSQACPDKGFPEFLWDKIPAKPHTNGPLPF